MSFSEGKSGHVQQVYNETIDEIRVDIRRQLIAEDNARDQSGSPETYSNGETMRRILARSRHALMIAQNVTVYRNVCSFLQ